MCAYKHENWKKADKPNLVGNFSFFWTSLHKQLQRIRTKPLPNESALEPVLAIRKCTHVPCYNVSMLMAD